MYIQNCVENSGKVIMHWTLPKQVIGFFKVISTYRLSVMAYDRNYATECLAKELRLPMRNQSIEITEIFGFVCFTLYVYIFYGQELSS